MSDDEDGWTGAFDEIITTLQHVLSKDQIRELEIVIDYDEHELAFEMLGSMLRQAEATVPELARTPFLRLAEQLRMDAARWRDVCPELPDPQNK